MMKDTQAYVKACDKCQKLSNFIKRPSEELTPMTTPRPFALWGLDIMSPFPIAVRQLKFLVVGIDSFTKWVEVETLATIMDDVHEIYTIKYSHIYIFSLTFMLFCD